MKHLDYSQKKYYETYGDRYGFCYNCSGNLVDGEKVSDYGVELVDE